MKTKLNRRRNEGFTLTELLVVVIILGVLAATIIPQFIGTTQQAKVAAAQSTIATLKSALERFNLNMDRYPTTEEGLKVLVEPPSDGDKKWKGPYIESVISDPWKNPYHYRSPGTRGKARYDVWSNGADGAEGGEDEAADIGNW